MRPATRFLLACLLTLSAAPAAIAQLSPSIAEMEKERLRKANEKPVVTFTPEDVAAIRSKRKDDPSLAWEADCAAQKADACFNLGNHLRNKNGRTPQDAVGEVAAYGRACQLNHAEGCYKLGEMHDKGMRAARDPKLALNVYGRACKLGFSPGCYSAATLLQSAKAPGAEEQAKQAQMVQNLYKAGCDLKHVYSCQAIGLAAPEVASTAPAAKSPQDADAAYLAGLGLEPATGSAVFRPSQIKTSDTGYVKYGLESDPLAAMVEKVNRERGSVLIDKAVRDFEQSIAAQGYVMVQKSYVLQKLNRHRIPMSTGSDYMVFAACNEHCKNVTATLEFIAESGGQGFKSDAGSAGESLTRSFAFTPRKTDAYSINVRATCLDAACTHGAAAQLAIFRRVKAFDIEAAPSNP